MSDPVTLAEAKLFLRVEHAAEDGLIATLIDAARARIETACELELDESSPAALRLAVLMLVLRAYERGGEPDLAPIEPWIAPWRRARL